MIRLLGIEVDRFASRLLIRLGVVGLLLLSALTLLIVWHDAAPPTPTEVAQAQRAFDEQSAQWKLNGEEQVADCLAQEKTEKDNATSNGQDPNGVDYGCDTMGPPKLTDYLPRNPRFAADTASLLSGLSALYVLVPVLLAVSFVAAEFSTGAIGNWLTFAPRRTRVLVSKLGAAGVATIPYTVVGLGLVIAGSWLIYAHFGGTGGGFGSVWAVAGRVLALAVAVAVGGAALGTLTRSTAASLGILLGWAVLVEGILMNIVNGLKPWSVITNISAWVDGSAQYYVNQCTSSPSGQSCSSIVHDVSQTHGAVVLGVITAAFVIAALFVFRRRDVG